VPAISPDLSLLIAHTQIIGLTLPFVDFLLSAGPRSVVGWIAGMAQVSRYPERSRCTVPNLYLSVEARCPFHETLIAVAPTQLPADDTSAPLNVWNDFSDSDWRSLYLIYTVTESLFLWTNIMAMGLQGVRDLLARASSSSCSSSRLI
jgi:hypothetical protein